MSAPRIVSHEEWLKSRLALLAREKELTRLRDEVARERRQLPWERVARNYLFRGPRGRLTLSDMFGPHGQLIVYHFTFAPESEEGCPGCSYWADNFNGIDTHLAARDTAFVAASRAPLDRLTAYRKRMGWTFRWVSSIGSDFACDFGVMRRTEEKEIAYNYGTTPADRDELPGLSAFVRQGNEVFHTYSTYARGLDVVNGTYALLDLTANGRQEEGLPFPMAWVRRRDQYQPY